MFSDFNINKLKNRRTFRHNDVPKYELVIYNYSTKSLSELSGIYLVPSHAMMIWIGEKDLIVKSRKFPEMVNKDLYLIGDEWCFGIINLKEPKEISLDEFRKLEDKHRIREDERHRWWPDKDILYAYEFDIIKLFEEPKRVKVPQGVQTFIKDVEFLQETGAADVTGAPIAATGLHPIVIWGKRKKKRKIKYGEEVFDLTDEEIENLYIRKKGGKWCVVHSDGRLIKCFPTKEEADRMHKAIIISKIKRGKMEENTHSDCINFINGWCKLKKKPVESDKPACPDFQPKKEMIRDTLLELVDNIELLSDKDLIDLHKKIHIMYENGN